MTLYALKPRFQALLRPLVGKLAAVGVTANQVTIAACLGSIVVGAVLVLGAGSPGLFAILPIWLFLRMALNAVDGMLAREFGQKSALGGYLNELGDVISDAVLYVPFALVVPFGPGWVGLVVVLAVISEMAGVLGRTRRYDGPFGKSDRAFVLGGLGLAVAIWAPLPGWAGWLMPVLAVLLVVTTVNRVRAGLAADASA